MPFFVPKNPFYSPSKDMTVGGRWETKIWPLGFISLLITSHRSTVVCLAFPSNEKFEYRSADTWSSACWRVFISRLILPSVCWSFFSVFSYATGILSSACWSCHRSTDNIDNIILSADWSHHQPVDHFLPALTVFGILTITWATQLGIDFRKMLWFKNFKGYNFHVFS